MTAHAAALVEVRAFSASRFLRLYDIDIRKDCLKLITAAFWAFDALILPVARGCHYIENFAATALQIIKRQDIHLHFKSIAIQQFTILQWS